MKKIRFHQPDKLTRIYVGDCCSILSQFEGKFDMIFADPPFNIGQDYGDSVDDDRSWMDYALFSLDWIIRCTRVLNDNGQFWFHVPDAIVEIILREAGARGMHRKDWVIWHYRFGQHTTSKFINSKTHLLHYVRNPMQYTWRPKSVMVKSDRASKYDDKRTRNTKSPGMRVPLDVWSVENDGEYWGRVQGNSKERRPDHPNQLPEKILERIIKSCTKKGDRILDPFLGSGTTCAVASALGRKSVGIEIEPKLARSASKRVREGAIRV